MAALIDAINVKRKTLFELENTPFCCLEADVNTPTARGGQTLVRLKMRNLLTNAVISIPTFSELPGLGSEVALHIHTHVREDQIALYGFLKPAEKQLFEKLITVSGIGPKLAITILSGMPADEMVGAIRGNDIGRLTRIPGIGKKTAERMVLELRDKLPPTSAETPVAPIISALEEDVLSALTNLGYQRPAAERALATAGKNEKEPTFEALFRNTLAALAK